MAYLSAELRTIYQTRHDGYEAQLILALDYLDNILAGDGIESGKFDSGEAMSWWKYTKPDDFLLKVIRPIEAQIDHYRNKLNGTGIVRLNLRRR